MNSSSAAATPCTTTRPGSSGLTPTTDTQLTTLSIDTALLAKRCRQTQTSVMHVVYTSNCRIAAAAPSQKPAIPLLNIAAQTKSESRDADDKPGLSMNSNKPPGIKGIALDISQLSRKHNYDDNDSSFDKIIEESQEISSSRGSVGNAARGISLDLTKAKAIQNEILNQTAMPRDRQDQPGTAACDTRIDAADRQASIRKQSPSFVKFKPSQVNRNAQNDACQSCISLPLGGVAQTDKAAQPFGLPLGTGSKRSQESESSGRYDVEQNTGPQLKINIKNVAKLKEDTHVKDEVDIYEPPKHKRG
jgi:hypothetical protein